MALLDTLRSRPDSYFWPEALGRSLGRPLAQLLQDLLELDQFGFGIERAAHRGVRYTGPANRLCPDQIEWQLGTRSIGRRIAVWQRVTSTNDVAARAARSRSNDGLVVLAEEQTAGRGRRHRRWHAPPESSILMSVLVFAPDPVRNRALLTCLASLAMADIAIERLGLPARIKWPNDVRVAGRKICGVLVEELGRNGGRSARRGIDKVASLDHAAAVDMVRPQPTWASRATVIGIGVNVNIAPHQFPADLADTATSLMTCCAQRLDRSDLTRSLIQRLDYYYRAAMAGDAATLWSRWRQLADLVGQTVRVEHACGEICGRLVDLWPQQSISIEVPSGEVIQLAPERVLGMHEHVK